MFPQREHHIAVVISPLRSITADQSQRCEAMGISVLSVNQHDAISAADRPLV